jgi:hypothetical protein
MVPPHQQEYLRMINLISKYATQQSPEKPKPEPSAVVGGMPASSDEQPRVP